MSTRVVNVRDLPRDPADWPDDHVYIGRSVAARGLPRSPWGNPYRIGEDGDRDAVVALYDHYLRARPALLARLHQIRGKTLVCWCAPERCHGDVLARLADEASR